MLQEYKTTTIYALPPLEGAAQDQDESAAMERFAARVGSLGHLLGASPAMRARLLEEVKVVARHVDGASEAGVDSGYGRRVLYEEGDRWSLAAIALRPGQKTEMHDHASWGCAVTVQGVERDRRFVPDECGDLVLSSEHDYPAGSGYVFDPTDVHQPVGADPEQVTVALHFLVHDQVYHNSRPESGVEIHRPTLKIAA